MASVQYCTQCGVKLPQNARFCPCCGVAVAEIEDGQPPPHAENNRTYGRYAAPPLSRAPLAISPHKPHNRKRWLPVIALAAVFLLPVALGTIFQISGTKVLASDIQSARGKRQQELKRGMSARYKGKDRPLGSGLILVDDAVTVRAEENNDDVFYLEGEIRNDSGKMYSTIILFWGVYDAAGKQLATATAMLRLDDGETGKFSAQVSAPYEQVRSYAIGDVIAM